MDVGSPIRSIIPSLDGAVLFALVRSPSALTGREVARLIPDGSPSGVAKVLKRLARHGIVDSESKGNAILYQLNRDHVTADAIRLLAGAWEEVWERVRRHVAEWPTLPVAVAVFGSVARGDGNHASDIDLLVVRPREVASEDPAWNELLTELGGQIRRWTGNPVYLLDRSVAELKELSSQGEPLVSALHQQAVTIVGEDVRRLLGALR